MSAASAAVPPNPSATAQPASRVSEDRILDIWVPLALNPAHPWFPGTSDNPTRWDAGLVTGSVSI